MIDGTSFGKITIDGKEHSEDVLIYPDGRVENRRVGHEITKDTISSLLNEKPDVIVIGTGQYGAGRVEDDARRAAQEKGIELIVEQTPKAVQRYNEECRKKRRTAAAMHLTC